MKVHYIKLMKMDLTGNKKSIAGRTSCNMLQIEDL